MRPEDLELVEKRLNVRLPEDYRQLMLRYPFAPGSQAEELWLLNDPEALIEINQDYRGNGFFGLPWPATYLSVGGDGAGNAYVLDLGGESATILLADHEARTIEPHAKDLSTWIERLRREEAEVEEDERRMAERRRDRKWWQTWR